MYFFLAWINLRKEICKHCRWMLQGVIQPLSSNYLFGCRSLVSVHLCEEIPSYTELMGNMAY